MIFRLTVLQTNSCQTLSAWLSVLLTLRARFKAILNRPFFKISSILWACQRAVCLLSKISPMDRLRPSPFKITIAILGLPATELPSASPDPRSPALLLIDTSVPLTASCHICLVILNVALCSSSMSYRAKDTCREFDWNSCRFVLLQFIRSSSGLIFGEKVTG